MDFLDRERLLHRTEGDPDLLREVVQVFFDTSAEILDHLRSAARDSDASGLLRGSRALFGALTDLGAHVALQAARELEAIATGSPPEGRSLELAPAAVRRLEEEIDRLRPPLRELARPGGH